jgi:hypothetical protein
MGNQTSQPQQPPSADQQQKQAPHTHHNPHHPYTHQHHNLNSNAAEIPSECPMHASRNQDNSKKNNESNKENKILLSKDNSLKENYIAATNALTVGGECPIKHEKDVNPLNMVFFCQILLNL